MKRLIFELCAIQQRIGIGLKYTPVARELKTEITVSRKQHGDEKMSICR